MKTRSKKIIFSAFALLLVTALGLCTLSLFYKKAPEQSIPNERTAEKARAKNFLFLGMDRAAGLCDVIMLVRADEDTGEITALQIPRDTYAAYTERSYKKLNGAYASLGGAENTASFLSSALGVRIDHYVCIGLDTLGDMVDALGGVDVDIPCDMRYSDPEQGLYISFEKGNTHLDGDMAEKFVRYRASYAEGDIGRLDAQKLFMAAFFQRAVDAMSPAMLLRLSVAAENVETDMGLSDMLEMGEKMLCANKQSVRMLTLPGTETTATQSGASYYVLSAPATAELTSMLFGREAEFDADGVFLNQNYKSFEDAYAQYVSYKTYSVGEIADGAVDIKTRR